MKPKLQKIEINYDQKVIHWGDLHTQHFYISKLNWKRISSTLGYFHNLKRSGTKENNKDLTKKLGISPKKFAHMIKGAQYKLWIKGKEDLISKLCVSLGSYSTSKIALLNKNWDVVQQYQKDGLDHLLPLAMYIGKTTKELKRLVGKSVWKSLCNNSFYRNKLVCSRLGECSDVNYGYFKRLTIASKIPSSIYRYQGVFTVDEGSLWASNILKKERRMCQPKSLDHLKYILYDTINMSRQLGAKFNPCWSHKTMVERHDKYSKMITAKQYPDEFISCLRDIPVKEYHHKGYTAKLLNTPLKIALQGRSQHHCVASYIRSVRDGEYLVYNVVHRDTEDTISTLGVNVREGTEWVGRVPIGDILIPSFESIEGSINQKRKRSFTFSQHYKANNKPVNDMYSTLIGGGKVTLGMKNSLESLAEELIKELNKEEEYYE